MTEEAQTPTEPATPATTHAFEAEVEAVLRLVVHSLYSHPEVFLRELISNASDALDKRRFRAISEPDLLPEGTTLSIRIEPDEKEATLTITDDGVGMTKDELTKNLGTIAKSGTRELADKLKAAQEAKGDLSTLNGQASPGTPAMIGQFGVGFYSAFLVADRVDVISRAAGERDAWMWSSDGQSAFTIAKASRVEMGTSVVLHLKADQRPMLTTWRLEELVHKYSDYVHFPIELRQAHEKDGTPPSYKTVNQGAPLWQRPASEVSEEQWQELYRHLSHDHEKPLAYDPFKVEGTQEFRGVLYVPRVAPFDLFHPEKKSGLRLYVKHVFVLEEAEELLPRWLRFVRGVVDSEDLPLNVSRELLQDSRITKTIKKHVQKRALDMLGKLATEKPEDYVLFWRSFGSVLKEGLHFEPETAAKLGKLLRFETTNDATALSSLDEVRSRMKEGQSAIYYLTGESKKSLLGSPHLEALQKRGYEVLLLTDPVDPFAIEALREWEGKKIVNAAGADLDLGAASEEEKASQKDADDRTKNLRDRIRIRLQQHVKEVRASTRLVGSAACLVVPEGELPAHVRRLLSRAQQPLPEDKRILEINPEHPAVRALAALLDEKPIHPELERFIDDLYTQAQIAEGTAVDDPGAFARRFTDLLAASVEAARTSS